jgi:hypothetical protein
MSSTIPHITIDASIKDGSDVTVTSTVYQCATSHSNVTVSDATSKTTVGYSSGMAIFTPLKFNQYDSNSKKGLVHVPIVEG